MFAVILVILTVRQLQGSRHSPSFKHFLLNPLGTIKTGSRLSFGIRTLVGEMMTVDSTEEKCSNGARHRCETCGSVSEQERVPAVQLLWFLDESA